MFGAKENNTEMRCPPEGRSVGGGLKNWRRKLKTKNCLFSPDDSLLSRSRFLLSPQPLPPTAYDVASHYKMT